LDRDGRRNACRLQGHGNACRLELVTEPCANCMAPAA
jgi:hypothetical protein